LTKPVNENKQCMTSQMMSSLIRHTIHRSDERNSTC